MKPLTKAQFAEALQKGLGRAVMHMREHASPELRDVILDACVHNRAYDPQLEGSRAEWLLSILELTGDEAYYRDRIIDAAGGGVVNTWDAVQVADFCLHFARRGHDDARRALYEIFERQQDDSASWLGAEQIIELDGVPGMVHIAEVLGAKLRDDPESREDNYLIDLASDEVHREAVMTALNARARTSANVRAYLHAVEEAARSRERWRRSPDRPRLTPEDILAGVDPAEPLNWSSYHIFAKDFTEEQIDRAYLLLLAEKRRIHLLRYLALFSHRPMPRVDKRLFDLAKSDDADIGCAAIRALAGTRDGSIHDFAVRALRENPSLIHRGALTLFKENYRHGDHTLIESLLPSLEDPDSLSNIAVDVLQVADYPSRSELADCALWVYENTTCSCCRNRAFERLLVWNAAPETMLKECLFDCDEDTRKLAEDSLRQEP